MKPQLLLSSLLLIFFSNSIVLGAVSAEQYNLSRTGRYVTLNNQPKPEQIDLLIQVIHVKFPQSIYKVKDAVNYILNFSGYTLMKDELMNQALITILNQKLPIVDRDLGPVALKKALEVLIGPAFYIKHDPINRRIYFRLKPNFQKEYSINKGKVFL